MPAAAGDSGIPRLPQPHAEMRKLELRKLLLLEGPFHRALFYLHSQNWVIPPREDGGQLSLDAKGLGDSTPQTREPLLEMTLGTSEPPNLRLHMPTPFSLEWQSWMLSIHSG